MDKVKKSRGAPDKYESTVKSRFEEIRDWIEKGATEKEVYKNLGVCKDTWIRYKKKYIELSDLIKTSRKTPVIKIKQAMLKRALGFQFEEKKVTSQYIEFDDGSGIKTPAKVVKIEVMTKTALPDVAAGLVLLQHWDLDENGKTKWSRDPANREIKEKELELKEKQIENEDW